MAMVFVRHVVMGMGQGRMTMRVRVRLAQGIERSVLMLMVLVVRMRMIVRDGIVNVKMLVMLSDVKPDANRHQASSDEKLGSQRFAEREHGHGGAEERRRREIGAGARRSEMAQGHHEKRQAGAVAQHANDAGQR
jgi:hypothetical protein